MYQIDFRWGADPHPAGGAYSAPSDPIAGIKGTYFQEKERGAERSTEGEREEANAVELSGGDPGVYL